MKAEIEKIIEEEIDNIIWGGSISELATAIDNYIKQNYTIKENKWTN